MPDVFEKQANWSRARTLQWLDHLPAANGFAMTLYFPPGLSAAAIEVELDASLGVEPRPEGLAAAVARSSTGAAVFWGQGVRCLVVPPFPIDCQQRFDRFETAPLRALLEAERTLALVLVRLGAYAVGLCRGERLLSGRAGTGNVHSRHKNGGWSQHRFERHRDKQMEYFFERACGHLREQVQPHWAEVDYVLYGGERHTLLAFRRQCPFAQGLEERSLPRLLNVGEPTMKVLNEAVREAWASRVTLWNTGEGELPAGRAAGGRSATG